AGPAACESCSRSRYWPWIGVPRQSFFQLLPCGPAIRGLVEAAIRAAPVKTKCRATPLISGSNQCARTFMVQRNISYTGIFVDEQDLAPGLAAVSGFVNPALLRRAPQPSDGRNINDVRIAGMDQD